MTDRETISAYDQNVDAYLEMVEYGKPGTALQAFIDLLPAGGTVLDLGCGPGNSSAMMRDAGLMVEAMDASPEMVSLAKEKFEIDATLATFDDLKETSRYDGIWANFSLLHAPREKFPEYLDAVSEALKTSGILHLGMKTGNGEERDHLGRFYTYYTLPELEQALTASGLDLLSKTEGEEKGLAGNIDPWAIIISSKS